MLSFWFYVAEVIDVVLAMVASGHAVLSKRDVRAAKLPRRLYRLMAHFFRQPREPCPSANPLRVDHVVCFVNVASTSTISICTIWRPVMPSPGCIS